MRIDGIIHARAPRFMFWIIRVSQQETGEASKEKAQGCVCLRRVWCSSTQQQQQHWAALGDSDMSSITVAEQ
jgi:hypothetical protein